MKERKQWDFETIVRIAHLYPTRTLFFRGHPRGYRAALKNGMLDYLFPRRVDKPKQTYTLPTKDQLRAIRPSVPLPHGKD